MGKGGLCLNEKECKNYGLFHYACQSAYQRVRGQQQRPEHCILWLFKQYRKRYGGADKAADDLVNQLCDYFLDGESETEEIPGEASDYKRIDVFQTDGHALEL